MANEISLSVSVSASKNGASVTGSSSQISTMAGDQMISNVQIIGTASEALVLGDVTTPGYVYLKNLDPTNFVSISVITPAMASTCFCKLLPGDMTIIKAVGTSPTLTAIADTGSVNLQVVAIEL